MELENLRKGISQVFLVVTTALASFFIPGNNVSLVDPQVQSSQIIVPETQMIYEQSPESDLKSNDVPASLALESENEFNLTPSPAFKPTSTKTPTPAIILKPKAQPTHIPLRSQSATLTITPSPITTLTPTPKSIVLVIPSVQPHPEIKSLDSDLIFTLINNKRTALNLKSFEKDDKLCRLADYRGSQLYEEIFVSGKLHQGLYDLNLPYWITENMAYYDSEQKILEWWLGSPIHKAAILGNSKYSCGVCLGNACAQLFTNYIPKV